MRTLILARDGENLEQAARAELTRLTRKLLVSTVPLPPLVERARLLRDFLTTCDFNALYQKTPLAGSAATDRLRLTELAQGQFEIAPEAAR